jgi:hypothetical protein
VQCPFHGGMISSVERTRVPGSIKITNIMISSVGVTAPLAVAPVAPLLCIWQGVTLALGVSIAWQPDLLAYKVWQSRESGRV